VTFNFAMIAALAASLLLSPTTAMAKIPDAIAAPNETKIIELHAEGAQIYECKADNNGKLVWQFREPIASLILDGKTVGRHYIGPSWELYEGSVVTGKVVARSPGDAPKDIPWLKLEVASHKGTGQLSEATTIQRINTKGGVAEGECGTAASLLRTLRTITESESATV
jgi:Protein of unknown function (DUF3455)